MSTGVADTTPSRPLGVADSNEIKSMAASMRSLFDAKSPPDRVAEIADGPDYFDKDLWKSLVSDLGVTGVLIPEEFGGLGLTWREMRVVLQESGRVLACVPLLSSAIAVSVLIRSGDDVARAALLPSVADGSQLLAVAIGDESMLSNSPRPSVTASHSDGTGWLLSGESRFVMDGMSADTLLVLASAEDERCGWFTVDVDRPQVSRTAMSVVDTTRPQAVVTFDSATASPIGRFALCEDLVGPVLDAAAVGLACEQSAAGQEILDRTVQYASTRYQFGQPIGSFQSVQHALADLAMLVDTTFSATEYAVWASCEQPEVLREAASMASVVCAESMHTVATECIQLHGGIGFTWEHFAHRYYRRALASWSQFGRPSFHRERLLRALSI